MLTKKQDSIMYSVSVIIPVYNRENTIIDALESVYKQTALHLIMQVIIVDDGSSDQTLQLIEAYIDLHPDFPIEIVRQSNKGVSVARNVGLQHAKGNWVAFLDSDDEWLPNKIERQFEVIGCHLEIDFLGADANENGLTIGLHRIKELYKVSLSDLLIKSFPFTPSIVMRKSIFDEIGGFDETRKFAEDIQYWLKICRYYNVYHLPEHLISIGHGKRTFGEKGLSANLKEMYQGTVLNIQELQREGIINTGFYLLLRVFYWMKYIRRILITKFARINTK